MTLQLHPESKANPLLRDIFSYFRSGEAIHDFTKKRFSKEIENIDELEPKLVLRGLLHYANGDLDEGEKVFKNAFSLFHSTPFLVVNHVSALHLLGHYQLVREHLKIYMDSSSPVVLIEALEDACTYFDLKLINYILKLLEPMEVALEQFQNEIGNARDRAEFIASFLDDTSKDAALIDNNIKILLQTLESEGFLYKACGARVHEGEVLDIFFKVDYPVEDVIRLNERLIDNLLDSDVYDSSITLRFRPYN